MNDLVGTSVLGFPVHRHGHVSKSIQAGIEIKQALATCQDAPDYWLRVIVGRYLEKFYRDRKDGHPAAEELPHAIASWVEDIGYNLSQEQDAERVIRGFMLLSRSIRKWPQPCELLKAMPGRTTPRPPPYTSEGGGVKSSPPVLGGAGGGKISDTAAEALDNIMNMLDDRSTEELNHGFNPL